MEFQPLHRAEAGGQAGADDVHVMSPGSQGLTELGGDDAAASEGGIADDGQTESVAASVHRDGLWGSQQSRERDERGRGVGEISPSPYSTPTRLPLCRSRASIMIKGSVTPGGRKFFLPLPPIWERWALKRPSSSPRYSPVTSDDYRGLEVLTAGVEEEQAGEPRVAGDVEFRQAGVEEGGAHDLSCRGVIRVEVLNVGSEDDFGTVFPDGRRHCTPGFDGYLQGGVGQSQVFPALRDPGSSPLSATPSDGLRRCPSCPTLRR